MKTLLALAVLLAAGCASTPKTQTTADAIKDLEKRYGDKVGTASKTELVQEFGTADWCEPKPGGGETCRFYKSLGVVWKGDPENRTKYQAFDEVMGDFDANGTLRDYKVRSQR